MARIYDGANPSNVLAQDIRLSEPSTLKEPEWVTATWEGLILPGNYVVEFYESGGEAFVYHFAVTYNSVVADAGRPFPCPPYAAARITVNNCCTTKQRQTIPVEWKLFYLPGDPSPNAPGYSPRLAAAAGTARTAGMQGGILDYRWRERGAAAPTFGGNFFVPSSSKDRIAGPVSASPIEVTGTDASGCLTMASTPELLTYCQHNR
jgi:hypothetical protein